MVKCSRRNAVLLIEGGAVRLNLLREICLCEICIHSGLIFPAIRIGSGQSVLLFGAELPVDCAVCKVKEIKENRSAVRFRLYFHEEHENTCFAFIVYGAALQENDFIAVLFAEILCCDVAEPEIQFRNTVNLPYSSASV